MVDRRETTTTQQAIPQAPFRSPVQIAAVVGLIGVVAVIIGALYLAQATVTATTGSELQELQRTRDFLQRANAEVEAQIAERRNLTTLLGRAQEIGFRLAEADDRLWLVVPGYSRFRATPTPIETPTPPLVYDETFNGWVQQQWSILVSQFEAWIGQNEPTPTPTP
ncbi:MAG: hypothetical protein IT323_07800 [Anaerolineae bacterium]|nr:hypothetical protein [Anaerolineae bacterium]